MAYQWPLLFLRIKPCFIVQVVIVAAALSMRGRPTESGERHNNGALVPTSHTVEPKNIQSAAVACLQRFHSVASYSNSSLAWISENRIT